MAQVRSALIAVEAAIDPASEVLRLHAHARKLAEEAAFRLTGP